VQSRCHVGIFADKPSKTKVGALGISGFFLKSCSVLWFVVFNLFSKLLYRDIVADRIKNGLTKESCLRPKITSPDHSWYVCDAINTIEHKAFTFIACIAYHAIRTFRTQSSLWSIYSFGSDTWCISQGLVKECTKFLHRKAGVKWYTGDFEFVCHSIKCFHLSLIVILKEAWSNTQGRV